MHPDPEMLEYAARTIGSAEAMVITAGAGMGVDSGLPDFRGPEGFWRDYPPFAKLGLSFEQLATPGWFERDPALAWGFYGHRLERYRRTTPTKDSPGCAAGRKQGPMAILCSRPTSMDNSRKRVLPRSA